MEAESNEEYSLAWKGHISHIRDSLIRLLHTNELCDVTLYAEGCKIGAHKILLAACSEYFSDLFKELKEDRPVIVLKGVEYEILLEILKFIYHGEVSIELPKLTAFLETAQFLQVSGLSKDKVVKKKTQIGVDESHQACNTENFSETQVSVSPSYIVTIDDDEIIDRSPNEPVAFSGIDQSIFAKACTVQHPQLSISNKIHRSDTQEEKPNNSPAIEHEKYSIESPPRTGEWTSDYDNVGQVSIENSPRMVSPNSTSSKRKRIKSERRSSLHDISEIDQEEFELSKMENDQSLQKAMLKTSFTSKLDNGYQCNICNRVYVKKDSLKKHFDLHLVNTTCEICGVTVSRREHLRRHMKLVHNKKRVFS